ncbi:MAG TPA: DUF1330 domain-containing protein [Pseudomonadales bacterium]|nr:DUF1330 domain-containing protein [Pseudomonadales bacterium]
MSVYIVATLKIEDRDAYGRYEDGFMEIFARFDGELLSVDEAPVQVEGDWPWTRTVLIRFPDADAMWRWYRSEDYQALMQHRLQASTGNIVMIQGLPGTP